MAQQDRPEAYPARSEAYSNAVVKELRRYLRVLPADAEVVAHCQGADCVYADHVVRELNRKGFRACRLIDGL